MGLRPCAALARAQVKDEGVLANPPPAAACMQSSICAQAVVLQQRSAALSPCTRYRVLDIGRVKHYRVLLL